MTLKIAIAGAGGRMGRQLIQAVHNAEGAELGAAFDVKVPLSLCRCWRACGYWCIRCQSIR